MIADEVAPAPVGDVDGGSPAAPSAPPVALHGATGNKGTGGAAHGEAVAPSPSSREDRGAPSPVAAAEGQPSPSSPALPAGAASAAGAPIQKPLPRNLSRKWCHNAACSKLRDHIAGTCVVAGFHQ